MEKYKKKILKAYLTMPPMNSLNHEYEIQESILAGYVTRYLAGERFKEEIKIYTNEIFENMYKKIDKCQNEKQKNELILQIFLIKIVTKIINEY